MDVTPRRINRSVYHNLFRIIASTNNNEEVIVDQLRNALDEALSTHRDAFNINYVHIQNDRRPQQFDGDAWIVEDDTAMVVGEENGVNDQISLAIASDHTLLTFATHKKYSKVIRLLMEYGADPNFYDNTLLKTPLRHALDMEDISSMTLLFDHFDCDLDLCQYTRTTTPPTTNRYSLIFDIVQSRKQPETLRFFFLHLVPSYYELTTDRAYDGPELLRTFTSLQAVLESSLFYLDVVISPTEVQSDEHGDVVQIMQSVYPMITNGCRMDILQYLINTWQLSIEQVVKNWYHCMLLETAKVQHLHCYQPPNISQSLIFHLFLFKLVGLYFHIRKDRSIPMLEYLFNELKVPLLLKLNATDSESLSSLLKQDTIFGTTFYRTNRNLLTECVHNFVVFQYITSKFSDEELRTQFDQDTMFTMLEDSPNCDLMSLKLLITKNMIKVDPSVVNKAGDNALFLACKQQNLPLVQYFIEEHGFSPHICNNDGVTPFMAACQQNGGVGTLGVLKYLFEVQHVNVDAKDRNGETALMKVRGSNCYKLVPFLVLEAKVDTSIADNSGKVAYEGSDPQVNFEIVQNMRKLVSFKK